MSCSSSRHTPVSDITVNDIKYEYHPDVEKFLELDIFNIVEYLYNIGLLNDIECRKIVTVNDVVGKRGVIYQIISTKDSQSVKKILEVFRRRLHPFQNPVILQQIFSYLKYDDLAICKRVCPYWKEIINSIIIAKFEDVNLDQFLLKLLSKTKEKIKHNYYYKTETVASVFQMMLPINPDNDEAMLEMLQIGRNVPHVDYSSINVSGTSESKIDNLIGNVMSNNTAILRNIFQFLSLASIKNCRTVSHTWNEVSETFVRKRAAVKFNYQFGPTDFINVSKYLSLPDLPFKYFKIGAFVRNRGNRYKTEKNMREGLSKFFTKFGKNIQNLELLYQWDLRSYLSNTCNLTELKLQSGGLYNNYKPNPDMMIPWSSLHSIKILCLKDAVVDVDSEIYLKRIAPLKVHLKQVRFFVGGRYTDEMTLNDYIDFTNATDIDVNGYFRPIKFDWSRDTFKAERITFSDIPFLNTEKSKSSVDYLNVFNRHSFSEKMGASVKQLMLGQGGHSLANLPTSLEKLAICPRNFNDVITSSDQPVFMPNLNYLFYGKGNEFHLLSLFDNCPNLTDIVVLGMDDMDIQRLPRNVKKMKVYSRYGKYKILGGSADEHFDLDLLILNFVSFRCLRRLNFDKLRPRILVVQVKYAYKHEDFVSFLRRSRNMEKIYVRFPPPKARRRVQQIVFSDSELSNIVDKESLYYEFSNERGKAIPWGEFFNIHRSLDLLTAMKDFLSEKNGEHGSQNLENFYTHFVREYNYNTEAESEDDYYDEFDDDDDDSDSD